MSEPKKWEALNDALCAGRDPNAEWYDGGIFGKCPPLWLAARKGAPRSTVDLLVAKRADVGWATKHGTTTLH